jgi:NitT/TauT family transport system permease protein
MATASSDGPVERAPSGKRAGARAAFGGRVLGCITNSWLFLAFFAGCILFWQYAIDIFDVPRYILPKPTTIVEKGWADIDRLLFYTYITGSETVIGYVISVVLAVPLGLAIAFSSILRRTLYPLCVSIEMVPKIAFAPLFVSWLGFGLLPKVIIVILVCFFPIVLNSILAFGSLSEELTRFCRMTGAGWFKTFIKVRLPAAMPQCFVGFKYAAINATVGATIAEFIGSDQGLGFYIQIVTGNPSPGSSF